MRGFREPLIVMRGFRGPLIVIRGFRGPLIVMRDFRDGSIPDRCRFASWSKTELQLFTLELK